MKLYAKLAKNPDKASAFQLEQGLNELSSEKIRLETRKKELKKELAEAYIAQALGEPSNAKSLQDEQSTLDGMLHAFGNIEASLKEALEKARKKEAEQRLKEIEAELKKNKAERERHSEKALSLLASAMAYLSSAWGLDSGNLQSACERIGAMWMTTGSELPRLYAQAVSKAEKPKTNAYSKFRELEQERAELEKLLGIGSFAPSEKREAVRDEPPAIFFHSIDSP